MHYQDHYLWASPLLGLDACLNRLHCLSQVVDEDVGQETPMLILNFSYRWNIAKLIFRSICMPIDR
jgi:hypothetical protein